LFETRPKQYVKVRRDKQPMIIEASQFQSLAAGLNSRYQLWEHLLRTYKVEVMAEIGSGRGLSQSISLNNASSLNITI
jgi:uncharacterized circularly permuted ATP-grasp superfamily protein